MIGILSSVVVAGLSLNEGYRAQRLWNQRRRVFLVAQARAAALGRPLIVVGDPDNGITTRFKKAYGCGDLCVDLSGCPACPVGLEVDITQGLPGVASDSAVVFVSCVLEYTDDPAAAMAELLRIAGSEQNLFVVAVSSETLTSYLYPGSKSQLRDGRWKKIDPVERVAVGVGLTVTSVVAISWLVGRPRAK